MASVMALISKAVFEKQARGATLGDRLELDRYVSQGKALATLADGGTLVLVTVRPGERLWLCAMLDAPKFEQTMWRAAKSPVPIVDVTELLPRLALASGQGIQAPAGKLGMSLQTPRTLAEEDVALFRSAAGGKSTADPKPRKRSVESKPRVIIPAGLARRLSTRESAPSPTTAKNPAKASSKRKKAESDDNAHHLLISALEVTPAELHPPEPFHCGGPQPKIDAESYVVAGLWLADRVAPLVEPRDRKTFDGWVELARRQLELGRRDKSLRAKLFKAKAASVSRIPLKLAIWAAHETANWAFRPIYAGGAARPAAGQLAKLLLKKSPKDVRAYLVDLDALCVHLELLAKLRECKLSPSASIEKTLGRGHDDGKITHWLMRLADRRYAILVKAGARWTLQEGKRDTVLAHVPDDGLEAAKAMLAAR